jgi:lambda family phage portal protein
MVGNLPPGASAKFLQPSGAGAFDPFSAHTLRAISVGLGIPFDMLTGDLSQANYSSLRAGRLPFRRLIEQDQELMHIQQMCKPVWAAFIDAAILSGALPERPGGYPVEWNPPGFDLVDPTKDVAASIAAVRAGFATWQQTVASMGYDPRKQADDIAEANDFFDERGLVLDIDPRRTAGTGGAQDARQNAAVEIAATGAVTPRQPAED